MTVNEHVKGHIGEKKEKKKPATTSSEWKVCFLNMFLTRCVVQKLCSIFKLLLMYSAKSVTRIDRVSSMDIQASNVL